MNCRTLSRGIFMIDDKTWLNDREAAAYLGLLKPGSYKSIRRWTRLGLIDCGTAGNRTMRWTRQQLDRFMMVNAKKRFWRQYAKSA